MAIELVFESHSTTVDIEQGRATGWLPGELSGQGRMRARDLGSRRRNDGITAVFSSDLGRAAETVSIAFGGSGIPVLYDWRLRECDYGQRNGMPTAEVHGRRREYLDQPYPGGESWRQVSPVSAASWATCRCAGTISESSPWGTSPPGGVWSISSVAQRWKTLPSRTSPGERDGSTGSASWADYLARA